MDAHKTTSCFMCIASELKYYLIPFPCNTCQKLSCLFAVALTAHKLNSKF